jgi:hypothetical protein
MVGRVLKQLEEPEDRDPMLEARGKTMVIFGTR